MSTTGPAAELAEFVDRELPVFLDRWPDPTSWDARIDWQRTLQKDGWAAPSWPEQHGGRGLSTLEVLACDDVLTSRGAPALPGVLGLKNVGPTLIGLGTPRQLEHLPRILSGEEVWCQGFSEPGAGSDLASLRTRAERDGDVFVVNGQKTWTSSGPHATHMMLLARTDPDAAKHRGITALEVDMRTPGIDVRPIRMITGEAEFAEVFFTDVRVPADALIGPLDGGWGVAMATLGHERAGVAAIAKRLLQEVQQTVAREAASGTSRSPVVVDDLVERYVECSVHGMLADQLLLTLADGGVPGAEQSVIKLVWSEAHQRFASTTLALAGLDGMDEGAAPGPSYDYLSARQMTIVAGTTQIVKNLIAERILGLPRD